MDVQGLIRDAAGGWIDRKLFDRTGRMKGVFSTNLGTLMNYIGATGKVSQGVGFEKGSLNEQNQKGYFRNLESGGMVYTFYIPKGQLTKRELDKISKTQGTRVDYLASKDAYRVQVTRGKEEAAKTIFIGSKGQYKVTTNLPLPLVNEIAMTTFKKWVDFALGLAPLGGQYVGRGAGRRTAPSQPSGRYALSLTMNHVSQNEFHIYSDPSKDSEVAQYSQIFENKPGRAAFELYARDYKNYGKHGRGVAVAKFGHDDLIQSPPSIRSFIEIGGARSKLQALGRISSAFQRAKSRKGQRYDDNDFFTISDNKPVKIPEMATWNAPFFLYKQMEAAIKKAESK